MIKFTKLTRVNMRKLQCTKKLVEHGIVFERLENGDGRFSINVMVDGQRIHRVIGKESEGLTIQQVGETISNLRTDARHSRLNLPKGRKTVFGFKEAAAKYLEKQKTENGKNLKSKTYQLNLHLTPFFNETPLDKISSFDVERYKKSRHDATVKNSSINRELATLSHLLTKAIEWKWLDYKPCQIKKLKEENNRISYLTIEQVDRLIDSAKQDMSPHIYLFIMIGLKTGMRRMEILSIKIEHIDLDKRVIHIPHAKAGARQQPITSHLVEILSAQLKMLPKDQEWLFPAGRSNTGHTMNIEKAFRRVVEAAGLDPKEVVRHTLRHTAITHLVQAGIDLPTVKRISGHKTLQMVERYSHQNGAHIEAAMDKLDERYQFQRAA